MKKIGGEFYVSVDVETDGPIPGDCNMVAVGASVCGARLYMDGYHFRPGNGATFYRELRTQFPGDQRTREWLAGQGFEVNSPQAIHPQDAMAHFKGWVEEQARKMSARPVYVAYPLSFDWSFTHWYFEHYLGFKSDPFGFSNALDIKTAFSIKSGRSLLGSTKKNMPGEVKDVQTPHTHNAKDDAVGQGELFANLMEWAPLMDDAVIQHCWEEVFGEDPQPEDFLPEFRAKKRIDEVLRTAIEANGRRA